MFLYSSLACALPVCIVYYVDKWTRRSGKTSSGSDHTHVTTTQGNPIAQWWTAERRTKLLARSNCLAAGALLSVGFLDIFIETMESFERAKESFDLKSSFPLASFVTLFGLFLILGVEQLTLAFYNTPQTDAPMTFSNGEAVQGSTILRQTASRASVRERTASLTAVVETVAVLPQTMERNSTAADRDHPTGGHSHDHTFPPTDGTEWRRVITLLCAISLHSVFEGMALGLSKTYSSVLTLFAALSMHKILIAISIGLNLAAETASSQKLNNKVTGKRDDKLLLYQLLAVLIFSGSSPIGTVIGWAVGAHSETTQFQWVSAVLQGVACGTFLYVVFCELLPKEMDDHLDKVGKFLFLIIGWALVSFVIAFGPQENEE